MLMFPQVPCLLILTDVEGGFREAGSRELMWRSSYNAEPSSFLILPCFLQPMVVVALVAFSFQLYRAPLIDWSTGWCRLVLQVHDNGPRPLPGERNLAVSSS